MKNFENFVVKYWWVAFVVLALTVLHDTSTLMLAGAIGLIVWVKNIKTKRNVTFLLDNSQENVVNYKGKLYTRDANGNIYKVKPGKNF